MKWLKFLIAGLVVTAAVMVFNPWSLDNDSWYVLAEGREIVNNGVYYEDQLSMHEGLEVTVQNYGFAAIFYLIYSVFGPVGIYISMLVLNLFLCYLIYKICMLLSNKNVNLSLIIAVLTDLLLSRWFVVTRAQMVSYCIIMLVIYLLELYIKRDNIKCLWWIPVLALLQVNLHASLWPMILLVVGVYIIDSFGFKKLHLDKYRTKPLLIVLIMSFLVGFLNPYGYRMMTFILTSYGVVEANETIGELNAFEPLGDGFSILLYITITVVMTLYIFGKNQNIKMRWLILMFGFLALGLNTVKGMSHLILVLLFPLAGVYNDVVVGGKYKKWWWMVASWCGVLAVGIVVAVSVVQIPGIIDGPSEELIEAVNAIDRDINSENKENLKVYVGYNNGGFLEYRGYKAYLDPRMEVFLKANNGKEDIFKEWYNLEHGNISKQDFLNKYDFDYLVVTEPEKLFDLSEQYRMINESNGDDGDKVRVYVKNG